MRTGGRETAGDGHNPTQIVRGRLRFQGPSILLRTLLIAVSISVVCTHVRVYVCACSVQICRYHSSTHMLPKSMPDSFHNGHGLMATHIFTYALSPGNLKLVSHFGAHHNGSQAWIHFLGPTWGAQALSVMFLS